MAFFSKEAYEGKQEYALRVAGIGIETIKEALGLDPDSEELNPIAKLSLARHTMHSSKDNNYDCFDELGYTGYADQNGLIDEVNRLNDKYKLVDFGIDKPVLPEVDTDSDEMDDLYDRFGIGREEENSDWKVCDKVYSLWRDEKNKCSNNIRNWFKKLNEKYGTDFPAYEKGLME